jgi:hypothetical protein
MNTETIPAPSEGSAAKQTWSTPVLTVLSVPVDTAAQTINGGDGGTSQT